MAELSNFRTLLSKGLEVAPRILGHQDRNVLSPSYGYFGRSYWAWKTSAMQDASNQYALYYLAIIWSLKENENAFYSDGRLLKWIFAGISRWRGLQNKDGSFDQVFPNEHSVGATSYTLLAVLETLKILGGNLDSSFKSSISESIARAGRFLLSNDETYAVISNHSALFAVAFQELWKFTGLRQYKEEAKKQIDIILRNAHKEGWFKEYEGADPGYTTQCIYYLCRLLEDGYDELKVPIETALKDYLSYFIHPDGSIGGHYGSRNSSLFYPGGIAILSGRYPEAMKILLSMCRGVQNGSSPPPNSLDFPNAVRLATNYLAAWMRIKEEKNTPIEAGDCVLPWERNGLWKEFPGAGAIVVSTPLYYAVVGTKKGGVFKVFDKAKRAVAYEDRGYFAMLGRKMTATQAFCESAVERTDRGIRITHPFFVVRLPEMSPAKHILLLFFGQTIFRWKLFRELFKKLLVSYLITGKVQTDGFYKRELIFGEGEIKVKDTIFAPKGKKLHNLRREPEHSTMHMASANYFAASHPGKGDEIITPEVSDKGLTVEYTISFGKDV